MRRRARARPRLRPRALGRERQGARARRRPGAGRGRRRQGRSAPRGAGRRGGANGRGRHRLGEPGRLGAAARGPLAGAAEPGLPAEPVPAVADAARTGATAPLRRRRRPERPTRALGLLGDGCRVLAREGRARPRPARAPAVALERDARVEHERRHERQRPCPAATRSRSPPASTRTEVRNDRPDQRAARPPARGRRAARLVLAGWFVLVSPQRSKAAALDAQIGDANVKLAATQAFLRSPAAQQSVAELRRLRVALPDDVEMSEILRQLAWASRVSGVRIDSITPSAPVPSTGAQAVPIALSVDGPLLPAREVHAPAPDARPRSRTARRTRRGGCTAIDNISFSTGDKGGLITATLALNAFVSAGSARRRRPRPRPRRRRP